MTPSRSPGWYADPDGVAGRLRWWDGREWAAMTLPAPRAAAGPPAPLANPAPGARRAGALSGRWMLYAAAVLAVSLLATVVLRSPAGPAGEIGSAGGLPTVGGQVVPVVPSLPSLPPVPVLPTAAPTYLTARIVDPAAGLSYQRPQGAWQLWDPTDLLLFGLGTAGVFQVTQRSTPGGGVDRAEVVSGPLLPVVTYTGPADLPEASTELAESLERVYYPRHARRALAARPLAVDGRPGYLVRFDVTYDPSVRGYDATGAAVAVVVVDTGRPVPGVLYVSIPDTRRDLWPGIDQVVDSLHLAR
ncbi:MAG TPA: DUF2510 domain-containing protein [Mycobacteriales bacterium]|nr:DUF2510 domain-containing protein [Mycobacteriales bacterium]